MYCCAGLPNKQSCKHNSQMPGISMHPFPEEPVVRRQWTQFVRRHRVYFNPSAYTAGPFLCSQHFAESCYSRSAMSSLPDFNKEGTRPRLNKDAVPSMSKCPAATDNSAIKAGKKERKARRTRRGKCSAKWHECHFTQQNSRRVRMIFAEEILICAAEENIYRV